MGLDTIVQETKTGVVINVYTVPRSNRNELAGIHGDAVRIRVTAPPIRGAANSALTAFVADQLQVARRHVEILSGHTSRLKIVAVTGVTKHAVLGWLSAAL